MASGIENTVRDFLERYGARFDAALKGDEPDIDEVVADFAPYFVGSSPVGVLGGANDEALREFIPQGFVHYREVGGTAMAVEDVTVTRLNDLHAFGRVDWAFDYTRADGVSGTIRFQNIYFVTIASGAPRIFAWITPDEEAAMKAHGLA